MPSPFTPCADAAIARLGERALIARIRRGLADVAPAAPEGPGDDCAVLAAAPLAGKRLVTTDAVIHGRHFDDAVSAGEAGRKLVNRNLSDIAAMGGTPADAVLALFLGGDVAADWLDAFIAGIRDAARPVGLRIVGGDVARTERGFFAASLTLTGYAGKPLLRTGARSGDFVYVTGTLGGSLAGKHHAFTPRLAEGRFLAAHPAVRAGMDVTDGLAKDLPDLLPPHTVALLDTGALPLSPAIAHAADRVRRALADGEDYELVVTADAAGADALEAAFHAAFPGTPFTRIARITPAAGLDAGRLYDETGALLAFSGYDHFGEGAAPAA